MSSIIINNNDYDKLNDYVNVSFTLQLSSELLRTVGNMCARPRKGLKVMFLCLQAKY